MEQERSFRAHVIRNTDVFWIEDQEMPLDHDSIRKILAGISGSSETHCQATVMLAHGERVMRPPRAEIAILHT